MTFAQLKEACERLRVVVDGTTGRNLISQVTVEEPRESLDELHFLKLVSWCYVFLVEASNPAARYITNLVRASSPGDFKRVESVNDDVICLRTVRVHNLSAASRSDDRKKTRATVWLALNGGDPLDWVTCCDALCTHVIVAVEILERKWLDVTSSKEDSANVIEHLLATIDREWPPHVFDRLIDAAASKLGLKTFDTVRYRELRLKELRSLASLFEIREHAEVAMSAAIYRELERTFGNLDAVVDNAAST